MEHLFTKELPDWRHTWEEWDFYIPEYNETNKNDVDGIVDAYIRMISLAMMRDIKIDAFVTMLKSYA